MIFERQILCALESSGVLETRLVSIMHVGVAHAPLVLCELKLIADFFPPCMVFSLSVCLSLSPLNILFNVSFGGVRCIQNGLRFTHSRFFSSVLFLYNVLLIDRRTMPTIKCLEEFFSSCLYFLPSFW